MADWINEAPTEGVGETQIAPMPVQAYSEATGEWRTPTWSYPAYSRWRLLRGVAKYGATAIAGAGVAAAVMALVLTGHRTTPAPAPAAAPITTPIASPPPPTIAPAPGPTSETTTPTVDDNFMAALINHNAPINKLSVAVNNAKAVCDELKEGKARPDVSEEIRTNTDGYTEIQAAIFVALAVNYYCPQYGAAPA